MNNYEFRSKNYTTELMTYDKEWNRVKSKVTIDIEDYATFCKVVEAVDAILKEECKDYRTFTGTLSKENEQLKKENKILLGLITEILDFIEDNNGVSLDEMKQFWKSKEKELKE